MSATDFLMGGGKKSISFAVLDPNTQQYVDKPLGTTYTGTVTRVGEPMQQRDPASNTPKVWPNGDPMMQLPVDLQTELRENADDDGQRTLYIKGTMRNAIRDAIRTSGADGLKVGGTLTVVFSGKDAPERAGMSGQKHYTATYAPPAATFLGAGDTQTPAAAPVNQEASQPTSAPVTAAPQQAPVPDPVETAKALIAAGMVDQLIAQVTGLGLDVLAAIRNLAPVTG